MGCDIHSVAQIKTKKCWKTVLQDVAEDTRNYDTFAMLADVRNGRGFAGCDSGDGFEPICEPRGLPSDFEVDEDGLHLFKKSVPSEVSSWMDKEYQERRAKEAKLKTFMYMGDHSHSWLLLSELKEYVEKNSNRKTIKRGIVSEEIYKNLKLYKDSKGGRPEQYCGNVFGGGIRVVTQEEYASGVRGQSSTHVKYSWEETYRSIGNLDKIVKSLEKVAKENEVKDDEVRYVFGFDS